MSTPRLFAAGCSAGSRERLSLALGHLASGGQTPPRVDVRDLELEKLVDGDVVFLAHETRDLPYASAFAACRAIKARGARIRVFVLIADDDTVSEEIARFCMADACVRLDANGALCEPERLASIIDPTRRDASGEALIAKLAARLDDAAARDTALQRMSAQLQESGFLQRLTDAETGLFDGPFASFKLDEEFKRSQRFHQPLSLVLLDCGAVLPDDAVDRRTALAEMASVFLNECRDIDTLARFTETIFLFLLPGTGRDGAASVAQRMLTGLRERQFAGGTEVVPAAGITTVPMTGIRDRGEFLARAEACLEVARTDATRSGLCAF